MAYVKGPFILKWGNNTLQDVESVDLSYDQESNDYTTVDGRKFTLRGAISASATITLLSSDAASIAPIVPQFAKNAGEAMSSGETVAESKVAIDVLAGDCTAADTKNDLDIISCGNPGEVLRLKACTTSISGMDLENNQLRTVELTFTGEPAQGIAAIQAFEQGALIGGSSS